MLQKLAYLAVLVVLLPLMMLTGLTMSPGMDADLAVAARHLRRPPVGALDPFHRRLGCWSLFVVVHLVMVVLAGPLNEIRSMITGRYRLPQEKR